MKNSVFANLEIFGLHLSLATFLLKVNIFNVIRLLSLQLL
jgi:hypothetical protein